MTATLSRSFDTSLSLSVPRGLAAATVEGVNEVADSSQPCTRFTAHLVSEVHVLSQCDNGFPLKYLHYTCISASFLVESCAALCTDCSLTDIVTLISVFCVNLIMFPLLCYDQWLNYGVNCVNCETGWKVLCECVCVRARLKFTMVDTEEHTEED